MNIKSAVMYILQFDAGGGCAVSIPGNAVASFLNSALTLNPAFALLSMNIIDSFCDLSSPSSIDTCRRSDKSVLFPTRTMMTSFPLSFRTSSIHFEVFRKEARSAAVRLRYKLFCRSCLAEYYHLLVMSYTTTATEESLMYEGINDLNLSCPAVSQSCNLTVLSSRYIVLDKKSMPIVA